MNFYRQAACKRAKLSAVRGAEGEREILKFFLAGSLSKLTRYMRYSRKVFKMVEKTKRCREQALRPCLEFQHLGC